MGSWELEAVLDSVQSTTSSLSTPLSKNHERLVLNLLDVIDSSIRMSLSIKYTFNLLGDLNPDQNSRVVEIRSTIQGLLGPVHHGGATENKSQNAVKRVPNSSQEPSAPESGTKHTWKPAKSHQAVELPFSVVRREKDIDQKRSELFAEWREAHESSPGGRGSTNRNPKFSHEEASKLRDRRRKDAQTTLGLREAGDEAQQIDDATTEELLEATAMIKRLTQDLSDNLKADSAVLDSLTGKQDEALDKVTQEGRKAEKLLKDNGGLGFWTQMAMFASALAVFCFMIFFIIVTKWSIFA